MAELLGGSFATGPYLLPFFFLPSKNLRQLQEQHKHPHPDIVAITATMIPTNGTQKVSSRGAVTKPRTNKAAKKITIATAIRKK